MYAQIILAILAAVALTGWVMAELDLRDEERLRIEAEWDRDMALGWAETQVVTDAVVHPPLRVVDGGEA